MTKQVYEVCLYAYCTFKVEAKTPEEAYALAVDSPITFDMRKTQDNIDPIKDYGWAWSDAMGAEVYDEKGNIVLEDN